MTKIRTYPLDREDLIEEIKISDERIEALEAELEVLHYFFTWDLDKLKERMAKGAKFTDQNCHIVLTLQGEIKILDK